MKKITVFIPIVLSGALGFLGWSYASGNLPFLNQFTDKLPSKSTDVVYVDSIASITGIENYGGIEQRFPGVVETQDEWYAKLDSERKVKEVFVEEGDQVKKGDPLFEYDSATDDEAIEKARINLDRLANDIEGKYQSIEQTKKQYAQATTQEDRLSLETKILQEENSIKQDEYEIKATNTELETLKKTTKDSIIKSGISGVVKKINDPDQNSSSMMMSGEDDGNFITITAMEDLRVKGFANEQNVDMLSEGMDVVVFSRADSSISWKGVISQIKIDNDNSSKSQGEYGYGGGTSSSSKYPFYIDVDEDAVPLKLGQHVYIEQDSGQADGNEGIELYSYYVEHDDDGKAYVWASKKDGNIEKRYVETDGSDDSDIVIVTGGLSLDEYIAVPGQDPKEGSPTLVTEYGFDEEESEWDEWNQEWEASAVGDMDYQDMGYGNDFDDFGTYEDWPADEIALDEDYEEW